MSLSVFASLVLSIVILASVESTVQHSSALNLPQNRLHGYVVGICRTENTPFRIKPSAHSHRLRAAGWNPFRHGFEQKCRRELRSDTGWDEGSIAHETTIGVSETVSGIVPYHGPICLAHTTDDLMYWCHYFHTFGIRSDMSPIMYMDSASEKTRTRDEVTPKRPSESEEWKQRFEALDKFRDRLKNASIEAASINEIMESIESDDVGEWVNLAAASTGAKIVGSNPEARNTYRVIDGKKDTFMKSDCKADQWLIVELAHAAKIKMIELTMKELYSPRVAGIRVYGRISSLSKNVTEYPAKFQSSRWHFLTLLAPENRKGTQHFPVISHGLVKFVGVHIVEYHGMGTACTINDISVYGLSPVNNLESLLEEAVQEDQGDELHPSLNEENSEGHEVPLTQALRTGDGQEELSEEAEPSLISLFHLEQQEHLSSAQHSEERSKENDEDASSRKTAKNGEGTPTVSTFRKMHQDVQTLKSSTTVLSQYVDELHDGLKQTIDELWNAQKHTNADGDDMLTHLRDMRASIERLEKRVERIELEQTAFTRRSQVTMGMIGFCVSAIGFLSLRSSSFAKRSHLFVATVFFLCCLNFALSFLNVITVLSPALLIKITRLKTKMRPIWKTALAR